MVRYLRTRLRVSARGAGAALLAASLMAVGSSGWAVGLGEIELDSALNERLEADIELIDAAGLQPTEILVSLASAEDFQRAGVERFFFLTQLRFDVTGDGAELDRVRVSSTQPITEPYLNFLVEVLWPGGRMLKEYTLLLDPPTFSRAPAPAVSAPSRSSTERDARTGRVQRPDPVGDGGTRVQLAPTGAASGSRAPAGAGDVVDGRFRMTDSSDTLWRIASRTRPAENVSVHQNMLAIQRLNPEAFLHGNINLLKAGYQLRLPTESEARSLVAAEAHRQVTLQNQDWRAISRGEQPAARADEDAVAATSAVPAASGSSSEPVALRAQVDATASGPGADAAQAAAGELRIVAGNGDSVSASAAVEDDEQLKVALEEQDRLSREVDDLAEQLSREAELASNQLAVKDRQLEVRDQQIAQMQAELERVRAELEQVRQDSQNQNQNAAQAADLAWWQSPYVLGAVAGALVLLLVYVLASARRRRATDDAFYQAIAAPPTAEQAPPPAEQAPPPAEPRAAGVAVAGAAAGAVALDDDHRAAAEPDLAAELRDAELSSDRAAVTGVGPNPASETSDVIGEADIYIAYGRYGQAAGLLGGVLEEDPDRNDVRLKLLELCAESRDREGFDRHMAELVQRCDDDEALLTARELAQRFAADDSDAAQADDDLLLGLDELDVEAPEGREAMDDALDPVLDDAAERDSRNGHYSLADEADRGDTAAVAADDETFELELDEAEPEITPRDAESGAGDLMGGDLGIDFSLDESAADAAVDGHRNGAAVEPMAESGADPVDLDEFGFTADELTLEEADDDAFDFGEAGDTASTKLDLARAYVDMGDKDGARDILDEVLTEGTDEQQQQARALLDEI